MDPDVRAAIACVVVAESGHVVSRGTAALVGERLALTALHVIADRTPEPAIPYGTEIQLMFPGHQTTARWPPLHCDRIQDWALLECTSAPPCAPLQLALGHDHDPWETVGFPDAKPNGFTVEGHITNVHMEVEPSVPAYQLYSEQAAAGKGLRVSGLSGSPVVVDGYVVGVIRWATLRPDDPLSTQPVKISEGGALFATAASDIADRSPEWFAPLDPVRGLPGLPPGPLPSRPYRYLQRYTAKEAEVFFGRGQDVLDIYRLITDPHGHALILIYGQSGVGKSSVIDAGVRPRLEEHFGNVEYARCDREQSIAAQLERAFVASNAPRADVKNMASMDVLGLWVAHEATSGRPLVIVIDQVEEAYIHAGPHREEIKSLLSTLQASLESRTPRLNGRLCLSFRKEWLAEVQNDIDAPGLDAAQKFLQPLTRDGIIETVTGLTPRGRLREYYQLSVDSRLPSLIADSLLSDLDSPIAPTLQVLLTNLWDGASAPPRSWTVDGYRALQARGLGLDDFLKKQMAAITDDGFEADGLLLDLLQFHTTSLATACTRRREDIEGQYGRDTARVERLLQSCLDRYLLADTRERDSRATRLAHDTLAPLVRSRFDTSVLPGQRARRILEARSAEWTGGREGPVLDAEDLAVVEAGRPGMRILTVDEERLIAESVARRERSRKRAEAERLAGDIDTLLTRHPIEALLKSVRATGLSLDAGGTVSPRVQASLLLATERVLERDVRTLGDAVKLERAGILVIRNVEDGFTIQPYTHRGEPAGAAVRIVGRYDSRHVAMSRCGRRFAVVEGGVESAGSDRTNVCAYDLEGQRVASTWLSAPVNAMTFLPDTFELLVAFGNGLLTRLSGDGDQERVEPWTRGDDSNPYVIALDAVIANGERAIFTLDANGVRRWSASGQMVSVWATGMMFHLAVAARTGNEVIVAVAGQNFAQVIQPAITTIVPVADANVICDIALSHDGERLALVHGDGTVSLHDTRGPRPGFHVRGSGGSWLRGQVEVEFSADDSTLMVTDDSNAVHWLDIRHIDGEACSASVTIDPDELEAPIAYHLGTDRHAFGTDELVIWSGDDVTKADGQPSALGAIDFSPDGRTLAIGYHNGLVTLCDAFALTLIRQLPLNSQTREQRVNRVAFSADGQFLLVSRRGGVDLWSADGRHLIFSAATHVPSHPAVLLADNILVVSREPPCRMVVFNFAGGIVGEPGLWVDGAAATACATSGDGSCLYVAALNRRLYRLKPDGTPVDRAADPVQLGEVVQQMIATATNVITAAPGGITIWDEPPAAPLVTLGATASVALSLCAGGETLGAAFYDGSVRRWRLDFDSRLTIACECLRGHPIWNNSDRDVVFDAIQTCERYAPHHHDKRIR